MMAEWEWNDGKFHYGLLRTLTWGSIACEGESRREQWDRLTTYRRRGVNAGLLWLLLALGSLLAVIIA
jgi:hypothetical protein